MAMSRALCNTVVVASSEVVRDDNKGALEVDEETLSTWIDKSLGCQPRDIVTFWFLSSLNVCCYQQHTLNDQKYLEIEMDLMLAAQIPALLVFAWVLTTYMTASFPMLREKRICLLIAHPDDEAMFFAPTILTLSRPELNNRIFILCLSSGDADGLGSIRKQELVASALQLGITSKEHVVVLEDARFPDSMSKTWNAEEISKVLTHYFAPKAAEASTSAAPPAMIDALLTFDQGGVSGHPNHISLLHGAKEFLRSLMQRHPGWDCPVKLYTLTSTNILRKYSSIVDCVVTTLLLIFTKKEKGGFPTPLLAVSGPGGVRKAQLAMTTAHKSQMRWFRWGWIGVSRYMVVNDLVKIKL